jgi:hypothetical protein
MVRKGTSIVTAHLHFNLSPLFRALTRKRPGKSFSMRACTIYTNTSTYILFRMRTYNAPVTICEVNSSIPNGYAKIAFFRPSLTIPVLEPA